MRHVVAAILPLSLVVMISPINIIPSILLLFSRRPLPNSLAFLAGFIAGFGAVLVALVALTSAFNLNVSNGGSGWSTALRFVLGIYLVFAAVRKFRGRPREGESGTMPGWMDGLLEYSTPRSFGAGMVLGAGNPKNIVVGIAAALEITAAALPVGQEAGSIALYVLIGSLGVALPIVTMLALGDRADKVLKGWRIWLTQNNASVMSVLFFVFGIVLISQAIGQA